MAIFNGFLYVYQRVWQAIHQTTHTGFPASDEPQTEPPSDRWTAAAATAAICPAHQLSPSKHEVLPELPAEWLVFPMLGR